MGGGPVRNMNMLVWGVDLVEEALIATAGEAAAGAHSAGGNVGLLLAAAARCCATDFIWRPRPLHAS